MQRWTHLDFAAGLGLLAIFALIASGCSSAGPGPDATPVNETAGQTTAMFSESRDSKGELIPDLLVDVPSGEVDSALANDLTTVFRTIRGGTDIEAVQRIGDSADPRAAWLITDLLRFVRGGDEADALATAFTKLTGPNLEATPDVWRVATDRMIAWDVPELPGYVGWKRLLFESVEPGWAPFFTDADADIDWRHLSWGGVLIDDRPLDRVDQPCPDGCIPAIDDPAVTDAAGGDWYPDDRIVFGITVNDESRAYPKHQMEVHEMVNDTLGGRRLGIPYCTLCGSAQAYFTDIISTGDADDVAAATVLPDDVGDVETLELRTSGLLSRSNKVMFEFHTRSVFDTFTGDAVTGPLRHAGVHLAQASVVTTTWGDWKSEHPDTTILAEDGGLGRTYLLDPLRGRDDNGPIFPIGDVDDRLDVQDSVVGVIAPDGTPVAFPADDAKDAISNGDTVELAGITIVADGDGLRAQRTDTGEEIASHQAFWFAWSQFHEQTALWVG